jgi:hypothetical protein
MIAQCNSSAVAERMSTSQLAAVTAGILNGQQAVERQPTAYGSSDTDSS